LTKFTSLINSQEKYRATIVIVTFNSSKVIFNTLAKLDFNRFKVIVVDNQSSDNCCQIVKDNFPMVKLIILPKNIGYGRANNIALRVIDTEFAIILNPDALIDNMAIDLMIEIVDKNSEIAIAGPILLNANDCQDQKSSQFNLAKHDATIILKQNLIAETELFYLVKYLIGAVMLLRMSIFKQIGFFDEKIFLYYEDDEITWRTISCGYKVAIIKDAFAFHLGGGSSGSSLRFLYKRFWHRALSKFYWKVKQKGQNQARISAIKLLLVFIIKSLFFLMIFRLRKSVEYFASASGTMAFLLNLTAFDKNDNSRG